MLKSKQEELGDDNNSDSGSIKSKDSKLELISFSNIKLEKMDQN